MLTKVLFWLFTLAFDLLIPGVMIFFGREFGKNPPTEITSGYGYRTNRSMKNKRTWDFAQRRMGEVWYQWGKNLLVPSVLALLSVLGRDVGTVGMVGLAVSGAQGAAMLATIVVVERALKKTFDQDGKRKTEMD